MSTVLERALQRERLARKTAESLLEDKSRELYQSYNRLEAANEELKRNQMQLVQAEKMASLGLLSAGVAHEINNPIGFVASNVAILREYAPRFFATYEKLLTLLQLDEKDPDFTPLKASILAWLNDQDIPYLVEDTGELLDEIEQGLIRVREIVESLQAFARSGTEQQQEIDLRACIRNTIALVKNDSRRHCELLDELREIPLIRGDGSKLGQVFLNLIVNAIQAHEGQAGTVVLSSESDDKWVTIRVADTGKGMPAEICARIFEPFFTTKEEGEGTGLGLAVSKGILDEHGAEVAVESQPGQGTTFVLRFPLIESED